MDTNLAGLAWTIPHQTPDRDWLRNEDEYYARMDQAWPLAGAVRGLAGLIRKLAAWRPVHRPVHRTTRAV